MYMKKKDDPSHAVVVRLHVLLRASTTCIVVLMLAPEYAGLSQFPRVLTSDHRSMSCPWFLGRGLVVNVFRDWRLILLVLWHCGRSLRPCRLSEIKGNRLTTVGYWGFGGRISLLFTLLRGLRFTLGKSLSRSDILFVSTAFFFLSGKHASLMVFAAAVWWVEWLCLFLNFFGLCFSGSSSEFDLRTRGRTSKFFVGT